MTEAIENKSRLNQESYNKANKDYHNELFRMSEAKVAFNQDLKLAKEYSSLYKENPSEDLRLSRLVILRWSLQNYKKMKKSNMELERIKKRVNHTYKKIKQINY